MLRYKDIVLSLRSALMIQNSETLVDTYTDEEKTGYGFIVYMLRGGEIHTKIVSTLPCLPYETSEKAKEMGEDIVKKAREIDLEPQISGLQKLLDPDESKSVSEVIRRANE